MATLILAVLLFVYSAAAVDYYETPHDHLTSLDHITTAEVKALFDCLLDRQVCSEDHAMIKGLYPEILETRCFRCGPWHRYVIKTFIDRAEKELPEEYLAYRNQFDPVKYNAFYQSLSS